MNLSSMTMRNFSVCSTVEGHYQVQQLQTGCILMPSSVVVSGSVYTGPAIQHPRSWTTQLMVLYFNTSYIILTMSYIHCYLTIAQVLPVLQSGNISPETTTSRQNLILKDRKDSKSCRIITFYCISCIKTWLTLKHRHLCNDICIRTIFYSLYFITSSCTLHFVSLCTKMHFVIL